MDQVKADPAGEILGGGNEKFLWKTIPLDQVVDDIVNGVERRAHVIVSPRKNALVARAPGVFRPVIDRIGFHGSTVPDAIAHASSTGWN
ncbi:hypothetical protein [Pseudofrankia sp. BMG5.36]|nr:hypothetical protein [Pseudofrankia sp. BMG5.36]OHV56579.1 hypothetical protein BCD48_43845 [Pseudofrankia sp. BMG5.36]